MFVLLSLAAEKSCYFMPSLLIDGTVTFVVVVLCMSVCITKGVVATVQISFDFLTFETKEKKVMPFKL